jgi:hypothetical protein
LAAEVGEGKEEEDGGRGRRREEEPESGDPACMNDASIPVK